MAKFDIPLTFTIATEAFIKSCEEAQRAFVHLSCTFLLVKLNALRSLLEES